MYQNMPLILCFTSVALQFVIFFNVKKYEKDILDNVFEGVFYKVKEGYAKKVFLFYYNPNNWGQVKNLHIKRLLLLNCIVASSFIISVLIFNYL